MKIVIYKIIYMSDIYKSKYLKYKNRYLSLKKMFGGGLTEEEYVRLLVKDYEFKKLIISYDNNDSKIQNNKQSAHAYAHTVWWNEEYNILDEKKEQLLKDIGLKAVDIYNATIDKVALDIGFEKLITSYNENVHNIQIHKQRFRTHPTNHTIYNNEADRLDTIKETMLKKIGLNTILIYKETVNKLVAAHKSTSAQVASALK